MTSSDGTGTSKTWLPSWIATKLSGECMESLEEDTMQKKRLATILRFVSSIYVDTSNIPKFVKSSYNENDYDDFFQHQKEDNEENSAKVLFSTNDFRKLIGMEGTNDFFSFYAGGEDCRSKRNEHGKGLWLRLKRFGSSCKKKPSYENPILLEYLNEWLEKLPEVHSIEELLTIYNIERAPKIQKNRQQIEGFLLEYKKYIRTAFYQETLEPIYNSLFEFCQKQNDKNDELVWGIGHAKRKSGDGRVVNGPILDVLVEAELSTDGAILIRPRDHTGVTLNREVVAALVTSEETPTQHSVLSRLHQTVGNMEASAICPGQPLTYISFLKRFAVEMSPGGSFQESSVTTTCALSNHLVVSEAFCLYARPKPSSIAARDANLISDSILKGQQVVPTASWSLTHGPTKLQQIVDTRNKKIQNGGVTNVTKWIKSNLFSDAIDNKGDEERIIFPLATSESQNRVSDLLLRQKYPAVVAEGPPGTGKTHVIANIICAYLCLGKRVLVCSKNANAMSVLRTRLPQVVRDLVVDVSSSEVEGMRQLQKTVESLANRISVASGDIEFEKCFLLQRAMADIETKLHDISHQMRSQSDRVRKLIQSPNGMKMIEKTDNLITNAPWLIEMVPRMSVHDLESLLDNLKYLVTDDHFLFNVTGFPSPPSNGMITLALAKSGSRISSISQATFSAFGSLPMVGSMMNNHRYEEIEKVHIKGNKPQSKNEWKVVAMALKHSLAVHKFEDNLWRPMVENYGWPKFSFWVQSNVRRTLELVKLAVEVKKLQLQMDVLKEMETTAQCRKLDTTRKRLANQKHRHAEELTDATVVLELSRRFSPDAQSALIRFSQIAAAAKFSKSTKKMSQRQRRRRQEYLDAFDQCCRFIPCWILTTSQISDYLPTECLFDLVIIDESSQSDIGALPAMMRGKQWLVVGDGKQVSPTEGFVSESIINNLRATLPHSPLQDAFLPGRSFFDLCAQAFPKGRVVLSEHFRCAPELIEFSNKQFYENRLVPLRLPTKLERFVPSLVDVRVKGGEKIGKVNENEAEKIVAMINELMVEMFEKNMKPRSIGVISLIGDEQSRLIRCRLLDSFGPEFLARHEVLVGDPPQFQGAEKDIVFLSMVCSKGNCPTQNQQYNFQRANVALSRARDRMVLVRSIDLKDISNDEDVKIPIIKFFMGKSLSETTPVVERIVNRYRGRTILKSKLEGKGYHVKDMGVVWNNGLCVENCKKSENRVGIIVDCEESHESEWELSFSQQIALERVGWKCIRIDALSIMVDYRTVLNDVFQFLTANGIDEPCLPDTDEDIDDEKIEKVQNIDTIIDRTNDEKNTYDVNNTRAEQISSAFDLSQDDTFDAARFGQVINNLDFLRARSTLAVTDDTCNPVVADVGRDKTFENNRTNDDHDTVEDEAIETEMPNRLTISGARCEKQKLHKITETEDIRSETDESDQSSSFYSGAKHRGFDNKRRRKRKRIDKYSRDGRWHPNQGIIEQQQADSDSDWYDTDSDIRNGTSNALNVCNEEITTPRTKSEKNPNI